MNGTTIELHIPTNQLVGGLVIGIFFIVGAVFVYLSFPENLLIKQAAGMFGAFTLVNSLLAIWQIIKPRTLVLEPDGFKCLGFEKGHLIRWADIGPLNLSKKPLLGSKRTILFDLKTQTKPSREQLNNLAFKGHTHSIPADFGVAPEKQLKLMQKMREKAISTQNPEMREELS